MKGQLLTNKLRRIKACDNEIERMCLKYVTRNQMFPLKNRMAAQFRLQEKSRDTATNYIRDRCMITSRPKSIIDEFHICRNLFKEMVMKKQIPGVTTSCW